MSSPSFELLRADDRRTVRDILKLSDSIINRVLMRDRPNMLVRAMRRGDWYGKLVLCQQVSDLVTQAAHQLGFVASRENLVGWHFITSFSPIDQMPSPDDLVLCRTWGQYSKKDYDGPFFGTRQELADRVPDGVQVTFQPELVAYRQIAHTPIGPGEDAHIWLDTSPEEVASGAFPMGVVASADLYPDRSWS